MDEDALETFALMEVLKKMMVEIEAMRVLIAIAFEGEPITRARIRAECAKTRGTAEMARRIENIAVGICRSSLKAVRSGGAKH